MGQMNKLRVAINAQLLPHKSGGIVSVLIGLVRALGRLDDDSVEYVIIGPRDDPDWLKPYLGPNQRTVAWEAASGPDVAVSRLARRLRLLRRPGNWLRPLLQNSAWPEVEVSDGFYESLGCDVIHFPYQRFVLCALPCLYNPHDLQHLHYPQFFSPEELARRDVIYTTGCRLAKVVVVGSEWVKQDVVENYGVAPGKVQVIPWAPPTQADPEPDHGEIEAIDRKYHLSEAFALYPAMAHTHKNHIRLLEALALLRDRDGIRLRLVCTGHQKGNWPQIQARLTELRLDNQVRFLGMLPRQDLRAIYRLAQFVIVPTLFEAASGPVFEAWAEGTPIACSTVTSLPQQVGDAALLFDPFSVEAIADAAKRMAGNETLRATLRQLGAKRLRDFSWQRTAQAYRAAYRKAAGRPLDEDDRRLLAWDWMRDPRAKPEMDA